MACTGFPFLLMSILSLVRSTDFRCEPLALAINECRIALSTFTGKPKGKFHPITGHEDPEGEQMFSCTLPSTSAIGGVGCSKPRLGRFTPGNDPVPIVQEAGWASGPVWTGAENLSPTGIPGPSSPEQVAVPTELSRPPSTCTVLYENIAPRRMFSTLYS